jgi:hypothetical protein
MFFIVGDSFSSDQSSESWVTLLTQHGKVTNLSQRGISEFRIFRIIEENLADINCADTMIVCHTNPSRIYIPDGIPYPSRSLATHSTCDMVASDAMVSGEWQDIARIYYKNFYDDYLQKKLFDFIFQEIHLMVKIPILDCSGFDLVGNADIISFADTWQQHPGNINHLDAEGNRMVYRQILKELTR